MNLRGTKQVPLQVKIIKEDLLDLVRRHAWQYNIHEVSDSGFNLNFRASYSPKFPFLMKLVMQGEIILKESISPAGSLWTEISYFDNLIKAVFRVFLQQTLAISAGLILVASLLAIVLKPPDIGPISILIGFIALFGFLMLVIWIYELSLIAHEYEGVRSELWKILASRTNDVVTVEEDIAEKKLNLWAISVIFIPGSFICGAILLLAIGMTIKQTVVAALAVFTIPISLLISLLWISLSFPLGYRVIIDIAGQCYFYTLVIISPVTLVLCTKHPSPNALISVLLPGATQKLESMASFLVVLIILFAPFILFIPNMSDLLKYIQEAKKPKEVNSVLKEIDDFSLNSKKVFIFRIFNFALASFSLIIIYWGLGYIGKSIAHPEVLWSSIIKIISHAFPTLKDAKEIGTFASLIIIWSLIPFALFSAAWMYEILMLLRWKVFPPLKKDSGRELLEALTHEGMFEEVKSSLKARHLAIYKDPNQHGICYFAQAARWSGIHGCYGIFLDVAAISALTRNNKEIEAVVWHEVGHMVRNKHRYRMLLAAIFFIWHSRISSLLRDSMALEFKADEFARARMGTGDFLCNVLLRASEQIRYKRYPIKRYRFSWNDLRLIVFWHDELSYIYPHYSMRYIHLKTM